MFTAIAWQFDPSVDPQQVADPVFPITIEVCRKRDGSTHYAIRQVGACFNRSGEWEHEPIPSERDEAFFARCRYADLETAMKICVAYFKDRPYGRIEQNKRGA